MTDDTEPNLDKILRGVADGSYTPHWQDERLVLTVPEAKQKIEALISDQVAKARIDEIMRMREAMTFTHMTPSIYAAERVKTLLGDE